MKRASRRRSGKLRLDRFGVLSGVFLTLEELAIFQQTVVAAHGENPQPLIARERQEISVVGDEVICACRQGRLKNRTVVGIARHPVTGGARWLYENRAAPGTPPSEEAEP